MEEILMMLTAKKVLEYKLNKIGSYYADCSMCGLCCKECDVSVFPYEVARISRFLGLSINKSKRKYFQKDDRYSIMYRIETPCPFLINNKCTIYSVRPELCRKFPFRVLIEDGELHVYNIEWCALSTHFYNGLKEFIEKNIKFKKVEAFNEESFKHFSKFYEDKRIMNNNEINGEEQSIMSSHSLSSIFLYVDWLERDLCERG